MINDNESEAENEYENEYIKYKICLCIMMVKCIKQHLSSIWSSIYEKVKQR